MREGSFVCEDLSPTEKFEHAFVFSSADEIDEVSQSSIFVLFDFDEFYVCMMWHEGSVSFGSFIYPFFASYFDDEFF